MYHSYYYVQLIIMYIIMYNKNKIFDIRNHIHIRDVLHIWSTQDNLITWNILLVLDNSKECFKNKLNGFKGKIDFTLLKFFVDERVYDVFINRIICLLI